MCSDKEKQSVPIRKCRVKRIGSIKEYADCLEPNSQSCAYAIRFGPMLLCHHPQWQQMVVVEE
jgi:hypothetical protein